MRTADFKKLTTTKVKENQSIKKSIIWKIVKGDLVVSRLKTNANKKKFLTNKQYLEVLEMEG